MLNDYDQCVVCGRNVPFSYGPFCTFGCASDPVKKRKQQKRKQQKNPLSDRQEAGQLSDGKGISEQRDPQPGRKGITAASLEEGSDEYFGQMVRPLITKSEMTRALKPHGFAPRGKGSFDRKRNQVSLLIDPLAGRGSVIQIWLNGSHYTANDGMWDISGKSPHGTIENADKFTGDPKKDAKAMLKGLADLMADQAYYDKEWGTKSASSTEGTNATSVLPQSRRKQQKNPPGWLGAGALRPAPVKAHKNPCEYCGGTGKNYQACWDLADAMFPEDCLECDGTGKEREVCDE